MARTSIPGSVTERSPDREPRLEPALDRVLTLQRAYGNRAVARLIKARQRSVQRVLMVGDHEYSQEDLETVLAGSGASAEAQRILVMWATSNLNKPFASLDAALAAAEGEAAQMHTDAGAAQVAESGEKPSAMETDDERTSEPPVEHKRRPISSRRLGPRGSVKSSPEQLLADAKRKRVGAVRQGRTRRQPFERAIAPVAKVLDGPTYKRSPVWGAGGCESYARIGPIELVGGSDSKSSLPANITRLRLRAPECNFVSGHLLNAMFGGAGDDSRNVTVLSHTGNMKCKKFDERIKEALFHLRRAYRAMWEGGIELGAQDLSIRVDVYVDTDSAWSVEFPTRYGNDRLFDGVFRWVHFSALLYGRRPTPAEFAGGATGRSYQQFLGELGQCQEAIQYATDLADIAHNRPS
jgi:ribosomal protein L12E/L44/L45/RPP1/RPP2